ncbi:Ig-like domain-containing protein [uncultured Roseibium sp.]|uniref:Ig-like domain-containing protein n=1 Tax=uncultured Roseibium sp. TaxID=1936171 RepID=UPI00321674F1
MTKLSVIWSLIAAVVVGGAALTTGIIYMDRQEKSAEAPASSAEETSEVASNSGTAEPSASQPEAADAGAQKENGPDISAKADKLTFDAVGVEPTGETVVAGRSDPGSIVALTANGKVVGKGVANNKGEWTIILEKPLEAGDYDVGLQITDDAGNVTHESTERLAVSVPEDGKSQPLVVLNKPEGPSDILQKPEPVETAAQEPAKETVVASAQDAEPAEPVVETKPEPETTSSGEPSVSGSEMTAGETGKPEQGTEVAKSETGISASAETPTATADAPQANGTTPAVEVTAVATGGSATDQAETAPTTRAVSAPAGEPVAGSSLKTTVEAVEAEGGKLYVAGTGEPGMKVRVYVGGEFVGETTVGANGRWLLEGGKTLQPGTVEVRADMIGDDEGTVVARAAVNFEKAAEQIVLTKVIVSGGTGADADGAGATVTRSLPNVIIHKGDNLWTISRRLYGDGFRYTTIYQANKGQIRNPDLIYPGQVFLTPEGDLNWKPETN